MSILIRGMKKPKNCDECPIKAWEDEWYVCPFSGVTTLSIGCQDSCPLVEIPPHGRLIDADAFERKVMFGDEEDLQDVIYSLRDYPSIIPADKEGEK